MTHATTNAERELPLDGLLPGLRPVVSSNLTHMSQWENARAEAEARLCRQSSLTSSSNSDVVQSFDVTPKAAVTNMITPSSASFMSSWKAQVAQTLRPNFGVVEVEKTPANPVNLQKFLQEWDSSLHTHLHGFSGYDSPIDVPDLSSGTSSEVVSPCETPQPCFNYILPSSAQITERLLASRCENLLHPRNNIFNSLELSDSCQASSFTQFSPTSTLHGPDGHDSSYNNSPCVSSNFNSGDSSFELLSQSFSNLIPPKNELQSSRGISLMQFPAQASFWSRQQVAMADALIQPEQAAYFLPELQVAPPKPTFNTDTVHVGVPNNIPIPQFDFLF